jgi:hypothetical protein
LELLVTKKEGIEEGVGSLRPFFRLKWSDNSIGKDSSFHMYLQREEDMENWANFCPLEETEDADMSVFTQRVPITTKSATLHLERFVIISQQ